MSSTPILAIRQLPPVNGQYPIRLTLKRPNQADIEAEANIAFALSDQEQADLRWYMEDYLQHAESVEAAHIEQIETMIRARGEELYGKVLAANQNTQAIWFAIREQLADLRIEITTGIAEAASIPWELLRDPQSDSAIAVRVQAFVRVQSNPNISFVQVPQAEDGRIRLLYVVCRPNGRADVDLRAIANRLLQGLGEHRAHFDITALRPPTFEQLQQMLTDAKEAGQPFHIVHFDGHGVYADLSQTMLSGFSNLMLGGNGKGKHGYLLFELPGSEENQRPVSGAELGKLLHDTGVPVLVLNACQTAMHEASEKPDAATVHDEIRAIGSLAQAVVDQGIPAVLGMRYSVFVVTAAQFIGELYAALAKGRSFGHAASKARRNLHDHPDRWVGLNPKPLQDWFVPVIYEAMPLKLPEAPPFALSQQPELDPVQHDEQLRRRVPDCGFIGRDETLLMLDRAFDTQPIVLLHAYAGQGKTSTAVEFARWYAQTGGLSESKACFGQTQPKQALDSSFCGVLFTSFEQHTDLTDALNQLGRVFAPILQANGIEWHSLNDATQRRQLVLQLLRLMPVLWIWDNVEPVAGFPAGSESAWTKDQQAELADFLKQLKLDKATKVKLLLTSRRDEQAWLGGIPFRIAMPRMSRADAAALALELGRERGWKPSDTADWGSLLDYCAGNPLTLRVIAGQAAGLRGRERIGQFIQTLRDGEQAIADTDSAEGRDRSLGASLDYGFRHAFTPDELPVIALLHLFQGVVDGRVLSNMGEHNDGLPELKGKPPIWLARLLDNAADIGVLTRLGGGRYDIHPALPWFLRQVFVKYYDGADGRSASTLVLRIWAESISGLAHHYHIEFNEGNREAIEFLSLQEFNLLQVRRLARHQRWCVPLLFTMHGLNDLYKYQGRISEWARLLTEITPEFCTEDDAPIPLLGWTDGYGSIMGFRVNLARRQEHNFAHAAALQEKLLDWERQKAADALALPEDAPLDIVQRDLIRTLGVSLFTMGQILSEQNNINCIKYYDEAISLYTRIRDTTAESIARFNIGHAYKDLTAIRNLDDAEAAYRQSMDMLDPRDSLARSKCLTQLGQIYQIRFQESREIEEPIEILIGHIRAAEACYLEALKIRPATASTSLGPLHANLARLYEEIGQIELVLEHYLSDVQISEQTGNYFDAGMSRHSVAIMFAKLSDQEEIATQRHILLNRARTYAEAALLDFRRYQGRASAETDQTLQLIADIDEAISSV